MQQTEWSPRADWEPFVLYKNANNWNGPPNCLQCLQPLQPADKERFPETITQRKTSNSYIRLYMNCRCTTCFNELFRHKYACFSFRWDMRRWYNPNQLTSSTYWTRSAPATQDQWAGVGYFPHTIQDEEGVTLFMHQNKSPTAPHPRTHYIPLPTSNKAVEDGMMQGPSLWFLDTINATARQWLPANYIWNAHSYPNVKWTFGQAFVIFAILNSIDTCPNAPNHRGCQHTPRLQSNATSDYCKYEQECARFTKHRQVVQVTNWSWANWQDWARYVN